MSSRVASVQWLTTPAVAHAALDAPRVGSAEGHVVRVAGWVRAASGFTPRCVELFVDGEFRRTLAFDVPRPDVSSIHGGDPKVGFDGGLLLAGCRSTVELEFRLALEPRSLPSEAFLRIGVERVRGIETGYSALLQPLSITSLGRTGTTLVLRYLTAHPAIAGRRLYPFETRIAAYWVHVVRVLADAANPRQSSHPDTFLVNPYLVGSNPFSAPPHAEEAGLRSWLAGELVERLAGFAQSTIDQHYARLEPTPDISRLRYFAEKCTPDHVPRLLREIYPGAREIFLVRDFRDMVSSILAFNEKRGLASFGYGDGDSVADFVRAKAYDAGQLLKALAERPDSLVLRYEDLLRDTRHELRRVLEYLDIPTIESDLDVILGTAGESLDPPEHRTSASPESSVGRWRRDLSPDLRALCREVFADHLTRAGYPVD